jgi:hypothetical protein
MILKRLIEKIHPHHNQSNQQQNHNNNSNNETASETLTNSQVNSNSEPVQLSTHSNNTTHHNKNITERNHSTPNFNVLRINNNERARRPSAGNNNNEATISRLNCQPDCTGNSKNSIKCCSSSIYNEIENEHSNHFYTSSTSSHSDVAKVYFIFILF